MDGKALADILAPGITVQEALDILLADDDGRYEPTIYITPPAANVLSDEDSGDEDEGGTADNLNGNQLLAEAEIVRICYEEDDVPINPQVSVHDPTPSTSQGHTTKNIENTGNSKQNIAKKRKTLSNKNEKNDTAKDTRPTWVNGDFCYNPPYFPAKEREYDSYNNLNPVELFELFIGSDMIELIATESNRYAAQKNLTMNPILPQEMKCFIGIMILSGYSQVPNKRMYWESCEDSHNSLVSGAMRRNRFEQILRVFHLCDNEIRTVLTDKLSKIRPLVENLKEKCLLHYVPERNLSYDESMIKYFGKHGMKQCIRGKPIRFGYKVWALTTEGGYMINFEIYQGKGNSPVTEISNKVGKCTAPLIRMMEELPDVKKNLPHHVHFDNLFTSLVLLQHLRELGYAGTGTLRENRIPKDCPLPPKKIMQKTNRGHSEAIISRNFGVLVCKWKDNSVVSLASNAYGVHPVSMVRRYSAQQKKHIQVSRPLIVQEYNRHMGGTDILNQNISCYRIDVRNKKWYWPLISWLIDASINNAWNLYKMSTNKKMPQLEFRRMIVSSYLNKYATLPKGPGRSSSIDRNSKYVRFDRIDHWIEKVPDSKRRRCAGQFCKSSVKTQCCKCDVGLCVECFRPFHSQP